MMRILTRTLLASTCLVAAVAPAAASAQTGDTTTDATQTDTGSADHASGGEVIVTGTRINRPNATAAAPVQSVTSSEIQAQAAVNVEDVLNRLPQVAPDSQQNYPDSDGRQRIKLRNLGFERTLVLVDGKRLGTQNGEDANMIPTTLLDRVDVLTGGASSTYGSDAIAGVVNFIMKRDFTGIELNTNYNFYNHHNDATLATQTAKPYGFTSPLGWVNDGARADVSLTAGTGLFHDRLHVEGFVDYRHADPVYMDQRSISTCPLLQGGTGSDVTCDISTFSPSGAVIPQSGANAGYTLVNNPNGNGTFVPFGVGPGLANNYTSTQSFQRRDQRINAGGFVTLKLSDAAELYGNVLWFHDKSSNSYYTRVETFSSFGSTPYEVNCDNPFLSGSQATAICGANAGTSALAPIDVRYRVNSFPLSTDTYTNAGTRVSGGIRGQLGDVWSYDLGGVYAASHQVIAYGDYSTYDRINNSLDVVDVNGTPTCASVVDGSDPSCVPFNAFRPGLDNQNLYTYLFNGRNGLSTTNTELYDVIGTVQGDLGKYGIKSPWAEQGVAVALGGEYREDHLHGFADETYREVNGGTDSRLHQNALEGYVEMQAPIVEHRAFADLLQLNAGYRVSKYTGNPKAFSTYKVEGLYAPIPDITFRASFNRAQRAPTVIETYQALNINYGVQGGSENDFCASTPDPTHPGQYIAPKATKAVCEATGLPDNLYGSTTLSCPDSQCTVRYGGFTVDPETAYTKTFGVILKPRFLPGLTLSVDRFLIDLNNSIGFNYDSYFYTGCLQTGNPFFCDKFVRNADGTLYSPASENPTTGYIRAGTTNYYKSKSHGWDIQGQYDLKMGGAGSLNFIFAGSLTTLAGGQDSPILPKYNCAGYFGGPCGQLIPKWTHGLRSTYVTPDRDISVSFNWRYIGPMTNVSNSGDPALGYSEANEKTAYYRIHAMNYFDLEMNFRVRKNFSFRIAANNLFDTQAPIVPNSYSYSLSRSNTIPQRYDALGRQIAIGTTVHF